MMSGRQAATGPIDRLPSNSTPRGSGTYTQAPDARRSAASILLSPSALFGILCRNLIQIIAAALALFTLGAVLLMVLPARYTATSLVLVDPREQRITNEQDVLPGIGQDTTALQSIIEIANSDGFLIPIIEKLDVANDSEISGGETNIAKLLTRFRGRLDVARRGITYVVAISFTSNNPDKAARYANTIAEAFVASQAKSRALATEEAADWLNNRLNALRDRLKTSEDAIAAFKAEHRIVDAGRDSTTRQIRATELSQQVSAAKLRTEEAKARYDQVQRDMRANVDASMGLRSELLTTLRAQRTQLNDQIAQKRAVFGDRHPDLVIALNQRDELGRQIEAERRRIVQAAKSDYETLRDQQKQLEGLLATVEAEMLTTAQAAVRLQDLQREADANRSIYEQFLARYKTTSEQRSLQTSQTQVVSLATAPARPNRPPTSLLLAGIALASVLAAVTATLALAITGARLPMLPLKLPVLTSPALAEDPKVKAALDLPVWGVIPTKAYASEFRSPRTHGTSPEIKANLTELLERIALSRGLRGQVVLFLTGSTPAGETAIADALNALAIEQGMLSVLIQVEQRSASQTSAFLATGIDAVPVRTTISSLSSLLSEPDSSDRARHGDMKSEFDVIVIDGTSVESTKDIAHLADYVDFAVFVVEGRTHDTRRLADALDALARNRKIETGVIIDQQPAAA
jgi:uncharacterized protein involved in exopolysaccharide biosynthesis